MAATTPKNDHDQIFQERARLEPSITFIFTGAESQVINRARIYQVLFYANAATRVPVLLDGLKAREEEIFEFKGLIRAGARKDVDGFWVAFKLFRDWLYTGEYTNPEIEATHLEAYVVAEKLQTPRFANAIMTLILQTIRSSKYDGILPATSSSSSPTQ